MPDTLRDTSVTSAFAELIYADVAWLRADFDEIVAAGFDISPPASLKPPSRSTGPRRSGFPVRADDLVGGLPTGKPRHRQRSPPPITALPDP
ncbi:hypothetical protein P3102_16905 [Amycolatopsis sp. QT-25]|uniref:hypothetical protein n=1 Tax=Amycolatopsis sp. QT-25 TaxID=3034022 RepID=UPI0023EB53EC|nr:hypothetical protein [Amycolatopsis sp. QT-25]WET82766.1 hypothetical protein P3102_16905 [Amycolatopsis sp. QT-25]